MNNVWGLFTEPRETWERIRERDWSVAEVYTRILLPLALIPPISGLIGTTQVGWQIANEEPVRLTLSSALPITIVYFGAILVAVFVIGTLIRWMGETYGADQSLGRCVALAAYTAVPLFLIGFFQIYPVLWVNFLVGLPALAYSVYLLYSGVPIMMEIPPERGFLFSSAVMAVGLVALVGLLATTVVLWSFGIGPTFTPNP